MKLGLYSITYLGLWYRGEALTLRLELLRFKQLLDWIAQAVVAILHDGSIPCVILDE